jgi:hypothetical protein
MKVINWQQIFVRQRIASAIKRAEFVSDRMSYIVLRGRCSECTCTNLGKSDDSKDSFYEELEKVFDHFS